MPTRTVLPFELLRSRGTSLTASASSKESVDRLGSGASLRRASSLAAS
jgi:hypothetical protein